MLVFGDAIRTEQAAAKCARLNEAVRAIGGMQPGLARHSALVAALIEAGELLQGIADHDLRRADEETYSPAQAAASVALRQLARAVRVSWRSGFSQVPPLSSVVIRINGLPDVIETKHCEGFAHYAVYPEAYAVAAADSGLAADTRVIGIRSIGTTLAAMVADGVGAPAFSTVRPAGHPFRRELALGQEARRALLGPAAACAVVDEGPGLSGSSFGAVADLLEDQGVAPKKLVFFPSHAGSPGPHAAERHRTRWARAARRFVPFETLFVASERREHRLAAWAADLLGVAEAPLEDISAGAWRRHRYRSEDDWPPVNAQQERRKFLMHGDSGTWLLKFAGLGQAGEAKLALARRLAAAGFIPPVVGYCHGFLVERWLTEARPLGRLALHQPALHQPAWPAEDGAYPVVAGEGPPSTTFLDADKESRGWRAEACRPARPRRDPSARHDGIAEQVGRYLGVRARWFPADTPGASPRRLLEMARHNAAQALGSALAARLDRWGPEAERLGARVRPVVTDNRMHAWEWLVMPGGRLLKADALDHHAGHDLIGCQDIVWDVAGAAVELDLPPLAQARLCAALARETGHAPDPELLAFYAPCYLAFQLGYWSMAADAAAPAEVPRLRAMSARYAERLLRWLGTGPR